ncbi:MAG: tail protein X [Pseudomonadota bacterium]
MIRYVTKDGDSLDWLCWKHYGRQSGTVEVVLAANPDLAGLGPILPTGIVITLPKLVDHTSNQPVRLWD